MIRVVFPPHRPPSAIWLVLLLSVRLIVPDGGQPFLLLVRQAIIKNLVNREPLGQMP